MDKASIVRALRDTAQSASNAIAGNVSGPVDLIAAALRAGGVPVPANAFGGSQWMAERGLTREVEQGAPRVVGETLGMVGPALAAQFAPQIASAANRAVDNAMAPTALSKQAGVVRVQGPQAEALETARKNAVKMLGLPENNTPMDRAKALGFDVDGFHGMPAPMRGSGFDPAMVAKNDYGAIGQGVYIDPSKDASYANAITNLLGNPSGSNVIPVKVRSGNMMDAADLPAIYSAERSKAVTEGLKQRGVDSVMSVVDGKPNELMVIAPSRIRSRFAAFDPDRINENDLLGRADPRLLGLLGLGTLGGVGAYNYLQAE